MTVEVVRLCSKEQPTDNPYEVSRAQKEDAALQAPTRNASIRARFRAYND